MSTGTSSTPGKDKQAGVAVLDEAGLTEADAARVLRDNAAGLLGIGARLPELVEG